MSNSNSVHLLLLGHPYLQIAQVDGGKTGNFSHKMHDQTD